MVCPRPPLAMIDPTAALMGLAMVVVVCMVLLLSKSGWASGLLAPLPTPEQQKTAQLKQLMLQAQQALKRQRFADALGYLYQARDTSPEHPSIWLQLGQVLRRLGQWPEALEALNKALALAPQHPIIQVKASYELGLGHQDAQAWPQAAIAWKNLLQWQPTNYEVIEKLAICHLHQGEQPQADALLADVEHAFRHVPSRQFDMQARRVEHLITAQRMADALPLLRQLASSDTKRSLPYKRQLGEWLLSQRQWPEGLVLLQQWLTAMRDLPHLPSYTECPQVASAMASAMVAQVLDEQAALAAESADEAQTSEAVALLRQRQAEAQLARLNEALALAPTNVDVLTALANWHTQQQQPHKALLFLQEQLMANPHDTVLLADVAQRLQADVGFEAARPYWETVLELDETHAMAAYQLGVGYGQQRQYKQAHYFLVKALHADPTHAKAAYNLGVTFEKLNQPIEALALFRQAVKLDPTLGAAQANLQRLQQLVQW
jgi:tetratricopeptide (TPR) repeat protein